jgi:hypothetical protein
MATLAGATLTADYLADDRANLIIEDSGGECLADIMVRKVAIDENISVSVMRIGSALLWSHARWVEAKGKELANDV